MIQTPMGLMFYLQNQLRCLGWAALATVLLVAASSPGWASPVLLSDSEHRGIVAFDPYQIFPENRVDNAIYSDNQIIFTKPGNVITFILPLEKEGRFLYLTQKDSESPELGIFSSPDDPGPRIKKVAEGLFHVVMVMEEIVYKKVYRVFQNNTVIDLLPSSKTADGITVGKTGMVFYHVSSMKNLEVDGKPSSEFGMRMHLVIFQEERLRHLDYPIVNTLPRLELTWVDETSIEYRLADGRTEVISIAQFQ